MQKDIFQLESIKFDLTQNSWAWFRHRKNYVNASEIGTIMGLNPYETPEDLIKKKIFGSQFVENEAMRHGKLTEPRANLFFSVKTNRNYTPCNFTRGMFSASLDGYHEESNTLLEIKCPLDPKGASWKNFYQTKAIPEYYWAQVQCQLFCSHTDLAYFLVFLNPQNYEVVEIQLDKTFIEKMFAVCEVYQQELAAYQSQIPQTQQSKSKTKK